MVRGFVDRRRELEFLNDKWSEDTRQLIVLYGRRRTGKTELINRFSEDRNSIYFLADERGIESNVDRFAGEAAEYFGDVRPDAESFEDVFRYIVNRRGNPLVIAVDEFSYLVETDDSIPSVFQRIWDQVLDGEEVFLILCGSSVSMMLEGALSYDSPLYGRRTGQWKLAPLDFGNARNFFPGYSLEEQVETYAVFGGIPAYLNKIDASESLEENINGRILSKGTFLYEEPEFLLRQSLRKPSRYMEILEEIAMGTTKTSDIANKVGIETSNLSPYLKKLKNLELIERETPVTAGEKSRGVNRLEDNFFRFYFRFIYSNKTELEAGKADEVGRTVQEELADYVSKTFEEVCREAIRKDTDYSKVGRWWYKEEEIDVAAVQTDSSRLLLGEVKWTSNKIGKPLLEDLERKQQKVRWKNGERKVEYALFSRKGFTEELESEAEEREDLKLYGLERLEKIFESFRE